VKVSDNVSRAKAASNEWSIRELRLLLTPRVIEEFVCHGQRQSVQSDSAIADNITQRRLIHLFLE
jgi:hypothetical protein